MIHPIPKRKHWRSKKYMEWVSHKPSCLNGQVPCVPHHHRHGSDGGTSIKPSDVWCIPVTVEQHTLIHAGSIKLDNDWVRALCLTQITEYMVEKGIR